MRSRLFLAVALLALSAQSQAQLQQILGGKRPPPFMHPSGVYALSLPRSWSSELDRSRQLVAHKKNGDQAELRISLEHVPAGADTEMVALNAGRALRKLPHYRAGGGGRLRVSGKPASVRSFEFDYKGNTDYTVAVEELYVVSGDILVRLHFEVMKRSLPRFKKDLAQIYDSLVVADLDASGQVLSPARPRTSRRGGTTVPDIPSFR